MQVKHAISQFQTEIAQTFVFEWTIQARSNENDWYV